MGQSSKIEWTDSTWNPVTGCTQVSPGCDHCYALALAQRRLRKVYLRREPVRLDESARSDPFSIRLWPERLLEPERWKPGRMILVNSMSDLFHAEIPEDYVRRLFEVMLRADWHVYQILTKRPARAIRFMKRHAGMFPESTVPEHIWVGTSVENQRQAHRVEQLRRVGARVRFLSCEPILGPLQFDLEGIHWLIAGGESGRGFRPLNLDWVRELRDQCRASRVPFFFKQVGGYTPKAGGRLLDGIEWSELPSVARSRLSAA